MRLLYTLLFYLSLPLVFLRLLFRSRRQPAYRARWTERLGFYKEHLEQCIWIHTVSVGEAIAAVPLIKALKNHYPHLPFLITTMTPTGSERVRSAFGDTVTHVYLPYDLPSAMQRFLKRFKPLIGIIMETELWPNLLNECHKKNIPVCLVNARLSEKSAAGYARIGSLTRAMLQQLTAIAAHGEPDANRFIKLGADKNRVVVTGNIKFDIEVAQELAQKTAEFRTTFLPHQFIWVAASTHEGEEEIILAAHKLIREKNQHAILILVPRHPDRFQAIAKLCAESFNTIRRSEKKPLAQDTGVYLADSMGELMLMYSVADIAFVGGSLIPRGGHNMLEPGVLGKPILTGPHLFNFKEISELFVAENALIKVDDVNSLAEKVVLLMENEVLRHELGANARNVVAKNRGALNKQIELIKQYCKN